ncbi:MAG: hypothetical protein JO154_10985 [Chitinophaga sp.]|uniref:hypothetical protein n=1 Tax=Chitinophaga sp. TaxID=1869181 RepID=UPI0025B93B50|nr:hypothetical protein [Chitinophaga sp.]MBV8253122.1 hypothetical protein [Chitinophaga sp.]
MRKTIFILLAFIGLSFSAHAQTALDLAVDNYTGATLSNISFTSQVEMKTFTNIAPGGGATGVLQLNLTEDVTITFFYSTMPRGAVAKVYNTDLNIPDATFNVQPGLNIFQLHAPISGGAIKVVIN